MGYIIFLYLLDRLNIPTIFAFTNNIKTEHWFEGVLPAMSTVLAALMGFAATMLAMIFTIRNSEKARKEDNAVKVLPLLKVCEGNKIGPRDLKIMFSHELDGSSDKDELSDCPDKLGIQIENVGRGELYNLKVVPIQNEFFNGEIRESETFPILYREESLRVRFLVKAKGPDSVKYEMNGSDSKFTKRIFIKVLFSDCYRNRYSQKVEAHITYHPDQYKNKNIIFSGSKVKECKITSAPERELNE